MAESRHSQSDLYIWDGIEGTSSASDLPTMDNSPGRRWGPDMSAVPSINNSNTQVPISQPSNIWTPRPNSITNKDTSLSPMDGLIRSAATVAKDSQAEGNGYYRIKPSGPMGRPISVPSPNMYPQNITSVSRHDNLIHPHNINSTSSSQGLLNSGPSPLVVPQPVAVKVPRPNKTYHCRMCDQEFTSKSDMQRHAKDIHKMEEKAHKCPTCFKSFPTTQQLTQHLLVHNNIRKYKCSYCDKAFKQLSHLQQHHRRHTGERPYKCSMEGCGKAFAQLSNLQQHQRNHDNRKNDPERKPYLCHICDRRFATDASLNNHISKVHLPVVMAPLPPTPHPPLPPLLLPPGGIHQNQIHDLGPGSYPMQCDSAEKENDNDSGPENLSLKKHPPPPPPPPPHHQSQPSPMPPLTPPVPMMPPSSRDDGLPPTSDRLQLPTMPPLQMTPENEERAKQIASRLMEISKRDLNLLRFTRAGLYDFPTQVPTLHHSLYAMPPQLPP